MENHFYHIRRAPLSVTIFITHMRYRSYANEYALAHVVVHLGIFMAIKSVLEELLPLIG